jgi:hypothetical protein
VRLTDEVIRVCEELPQGRILELIPERIRLAGEERQLFAKQLRMVRFLEQTARKNIQIRSKLLAQDRRQKRIPVIQVSPFDNGRC